MTSPVNTEVKFFHSDMAGAPVLTGLVGSLISVLDGCLINGFNAKSVTSLEVASNVATMTTSTTFAAEVGAVVLVSGATPAALNGEQKVTAISATTVSFATTGISDQTATGTISFLMAPAGWTKPFSGTNLAVYRSADVTSTQNYLRVNDSVSATSCRVVGYVTMSDINTGSGAFPTEVQVSGGLWWSKSTVLDSSVRDWMLFSDGRVFYIATSPIAPATGKGAFNIYTFGDMNPYKVGDIYHCVMNGNGTNVAATITPANDTMNFSNGYLSTQTYVPRGYWGLGLPLSLVKNAPALVSSATNWLSGGKDGGQPAYPNAIDGAMYVSQVQYSNYTPNLMRGVAGGLYHVPMNVPTGMFQAKQKITGVAGMAGKTLMTVTSYVASSVVPYSAPTLFDITGPWR